MRSLRLPHLQLDELRTRLRGQTHALWLWLVVDPISKIIPVLHLGARNQAAAHIVVHELHTRLAPGCLPVFTSDGLNQYFYALTAHFGQWVVGVGRRARRWQVAAGLIYGQVKKRYQQRRLVRVSYLMRCGTREALHSTLQGLGLSGRLNTAFVERLNLTVRQSVAALVRRTWSTLQAVPPLLVHLEWWRAYYHLTLLANRYPVGANAAKCACRFGAGVGSSNHSTTRTRLIPTAIRTCCRCVRARPI